MTSLQSLLFLLQIKKCKPELRQSFYKSLYELLLNATQKVLPAEPQIFKALKNQELELEKLEIHFEQYKKLLLNIKLSGMKRTM